MRICMWQSMVENEHFYNWINSINSDERVPSSESPLSLPVLSTAGAAVVFHSADLESIVYI